jgi:peptidoglycan-associated lipoprotein
MVAIFRVYFSRYLSGKRDKTVLMGEEFMKLKTLVQMTLVSCSILALSACSSSHKNAGDAAGANMDGAVQTSGLGEGDGFGGDSGPQDSKYKRTYYFDYDKSYVRDEDKPAIAANADYLVAHPGAKVIVEGHTDPRGSREYNVALGEHRANAVADLLKAKDVNPRQVRVVSYGAERLGAPGHAENDYQMDRRAVIVYTQK